MKSKKSYTKWRRELKAELVRAGVKYTEIAALAGRSPTTVAVIISKYPKFKSYRIQKAIADMLGVAYTSLWVEPHKRRDPDPADQNFKEAVNA